MAQNFYVTNSKVLIVILHEEHIVLMIYHLNKLKRYDAIEYLTDTEGMSFQLFCNKQYMFTLIPLMKEYLCFELSDFDKRYTLIDWNIYSKITASLFSVFLNEPVS